MAVRVRTISTAVPRTALEQHRVRDLFAAQPDLTRLGRRLVTAAFDASGIDRRHTVVADLDRDRAAAGEAPHTFVDSGGTFRSPTTGERNDLYITEAGPLAVEAARGALRDVDDLGPADITHVITVSCTGFSAPGVDQQLMRELGLAPHVERFHVGFMGCYAAFPALRMAKAFCDSRPDAVVLVVSVELCTLHVRSSNDSDQIVASSVFADGAAAAVVTARPRRAGGDGARPGTALVLDSFASTVTPVGESEMAWTIGDHGFDMVLSAAVPRIIDEYIAGALRPLLEADPWLTRSTDAARDVATWAVHPGGRSILDRVQSQLGLSDTQLAPSREVLRRWGNMSSATILFVLKEIMEGATGEQAGDRVCAMAFGPGLTVETGLLTIDPAPLPTHASGAAEPVGAAAGD
jgi:predicted naringenin-chalcone synthase